MTVLLRHSYSHMTDIYFELCEARNFLIDMANYPQELAQVAVCQSHTGHMTGLLFLLARPLRLNTNECMNE